MTCVYRGTGLPRAVKCEEPSSQAWEQTLVNVVWWRESLDQRGRTCPKWPEILLGVLGKNYTKEEEGLFLCGWRR